MKRLVLGFLLLASVALVSGCKHVEYRLVQPATAAHQITKDGITVPVEPLQYQLATRHNRVAMRITNPTDTPIRLLQNRSYLVDPLGASHPVRGRFIAPHSYVDMSLPPQPGYYYSYNYPWVGARYSPIWNPYWDVDMGYVYQPWSYAYEVVTPYDWVWKDGQARLHLGYGRDNNQFIDHDFVIERLSK